MATKHHGGSGRPAGPLFDLYERYIGEPQSRKDVYGYWTFLAGYALGIVGVAVYLVGVTPEGPQFFVREVAITLSAVGLTLALFGFGLMLPVRRRGIYLSVVGLIVALGSVGAFVVGYPARWLVDADYTGTVIVAYTAGVALVAGVAALVPVLTGEKGWLVEDLEEYAGHPPVLVGETVHGALFTVFKVGTGAWTWRVLQQDAVGENAVGPHSRPDVEAAVEDARALIGNAGLQEITTAAFRLYESDAGEWRWSLMREDGYAVAVSGDVHPDRDAAENAASLLKEAGPGASVIDIRGAAYDVYDADGSWRWRLLDEQRRPLATSPSAFPNRASAEAAIEPVRSRFADARLIAIDELGVELYEADGRWRWRLIDAADEVLLTGADAADTRRAAETAVDRWLPGISAAPVLEPDRSAFELFDREAGWQFRLVDSDGDRVAASGGAFVDETSAQREAERMVDTAAEADIIQFEGGSFELHPDDEGAWHWRLVTNDRELVASSGEGYPDQAAAEAAVEGVRERAVVADLIEFEHAAFQQYETDGRWRWRLIDADGTVLADSGDDYASRDEAGAAMTTLKEHAPNADIIEIETAAFELFEDASGWGWRLIDETGAMVAQGADRHPARADAQRAMDTLVANADGAEVRGMARPAFQFYTDDDGWRWRYVHPDGLVAAEGTDAHATRDELVAAVETVREQAAAAVIHVIDPLAFELLDGGQRRFRLIDADRTVVAESPRRYDDRASLDAVVERLQTHADDATVFAIGDSAIRLNPDDGGWQWELVDGDRRALATGPVTEVDRASAETAAERARTRAPDAELVDFDVAAFELYRDDGGLRWRLLDDSGTVVATAAEPVGTPAEARAAVDDIKELVDDASVLEIDEAAFELHREHEGWSWRLVDDDGSTLVRSVEPLPNRADAREALREVKAYAPDGRITVVE